MGHASKSSLHTQVHTDLQALEGFGRSKHLDKALGLTDKYIYSFSTMQTYEKAAHTFVDWCKSPEQWSKIRDELGHTAKTLAELRPYAAAWVKDQMDRGLSAYTIKMRVSALEKLYQSKLDIETPATSRQEITRSRGEAVRDTHFSLSKNADIITVCQCVGFRRSELQACRSEDLQRMSDGSYTVEIRGKGGKIRRAPVVGTPQEVEKAVSWIKSATGRNYVPSMMDVHAYRAEYACKVYNSYAQPTEALKGRRIDYTALTGKASKDGTHIYKSALYVCRADKAGVAYDRVAMIKTSQALGHNRESVVGEHYLYRL